MVSAVEHIGRWLAGATATADALEKVAPTPPPPSRPARADQATGMRLVVTANPEIIFQARQDKELEQVLQSADLVVADGIGVVWAAQRYGQPVPERVPGVELMTHLLAAAAQQGWRPFFLGTRPEVITQAVDKASTMYPDLQLAGYHHGYFGPQEEEEVLAKVEAARPDLLLAGMGAQRELKWLHQHRRQLPVKVAMGVGGSFDVLAGAVQRAPDWVQRIHLEWLYRLFKEPQRWRRQTVLPRFVLAVLNESRRGRR